MHFAHAGLQVLLVAVLEGTQVRTQASFQGARQRHNPVFATFSIVDGDGSLSKIKILDPESQSFHLPKASAVDHFAHQSPGIFQFIEDGADFLTGQDGRRSTRSGPGWSESEIQVFDSVDGLAEEGQGVERLALGRG